MSLDYINEAFRSLESLNEDIFSVDRDGINELSDFMSSDINDEEKISIIDMDAETEDDLQDSYVGKIICDCNVCHSHVFKDKDQITIDEDGVVDIEDDCPYCGEHNGFVIIGEITEFNPNADEEVAEETPNEEEEVTEEPAEEADDEAAEIDEVQEEKALEESLNESPRKFKPHTMRLLKMIGSDLVNEAVEEPEELNELFGLGKGKVNTYYIGFPSVGSLNVKSLKRDLEDLVYDYSESNEPAPSNAFRFKPYWAISFKISEKKFKQFEEELDRILNEDSVKYVTGNVSGNRGTKGSNFNLASIVKLNGPFNESLEGSDVEDENTEELNELFGLGKKKTKTYYLGFPSIGSLNAKLLKRDLQDIVDDYAEESEPAPSNAFSFKPYYAVAFKITDKNFKLVEQEIEGLSSAKYLGLGNDSRNNKTGETSFDLRKGEVQKLIKMKGPFNESLEEDTLEESFNNVSIETDDQKMTMTSEENGKVTVTTEPLEQAPAAEGEMITPISDETQDEIIDATAEVVEEEPAEEVADTEAESQDATEGEETPAEEEEVDAEIDELDEEGMDELGESYLKKVYENVDSFKTSAVSTSGNKLFIEGVINFKSGASKKTGFIFEAKEATRDGKVKFIGENAHFCRGKRAFTLAGSLNEKKLMVESLTYNYRAKNNEGKSTRVYGTISRNK